jgi:pyruvate ferredoxin oxidoreductase gamma subunit
MEVPVVQQTVEQAVQAYQQLGSQSGLVRESRASPAVTYTRPAWIDLPLESARIASPDIYQVATSERVKTGLWRTLRPVIDHDRCHLCWACNALCPDGVIDMADGAPHIDYAHCKGCLICVVQCPYNAITAIPEHGCAEEAAP